MLIVPPDMIWGLPELGVSLYRWMFYRETPKIASGYVKIAIENDHL